MTVETKEQSAVRPAERVGRRHWTQVDRAFGIRMATLVQPAPPYSALYGLVKVGLVGLDWAHRQAGLYPTHVFLREAERRRALDLRPTLTGWLDIATEHGAGKYMNDDYLSPFSRFPDFSAESILSDLFDRIRAYFAMNAPFGQVGAEKGLARLCWLLATLEYVYRNDLVDEPFYRLFQESTPTVEQLHAAADEAVVTESVELVRRLHTSGSLNEMRRLAGHPPTGRPWGIARPVFGSYWSDNDILVGGPNGATLIDVSSVIATNKLSRSRRWIWRLLACAWLDTADAYRIRNVALYFARHGVLVAWPLDALTEALLAGEDPERARREFLELASRLREESVGRGEAGDTGEDPNEGVTGNPH
ncbi:hypothetical protein GCM10017600_47590 [Streptosporangium carneum]|uniref:Uncharacterized protein n=1 Tax=Streptosporangium carneum TaxID=47481 RepID=A0A9W6MEP6_9ACTN|nr:hypothetical protein GCM10017600_47590 [Streptosporangium carneum]